MKCAHLPNRSRSTGFTLIELIVVMAIIATLASIGTHAAQSALRQSRITQAKVQIVSLKNALASYRSEYGQFPVSDRGEHVAEGLPMEILMGSDNQAARDWNPRNITFFTSQVTHHPRKPGIVLESHRLNDPWGTPFRMVLDIDDERSVRLPKAYRDIYGPSLPGYRIFIHSAGPDRSFSTVQDNVHELK